MVARYVGIDVSKDKLDVHMASPGRSLNVPRTEAGPSELAKALQDISVAMVAAEATGGYETLVVYSLTAAGLPAVIVNPAQVRQYGRYRGGFITRRLGRPAEGVHAVQMELACRTDMREAEGPVGEGAWPTPWDDAFAAPTRATLERALRACLDFARAG